MFRGGLNLSDTCEKLLEPDDITVGCAVGKLYLLSK